MNMKSLNLASLSIADLSRLHEEVRGVLTQKIEAEKRKLEEQLSKLSAPQRVVKASSDGSGGTHHTGRRPYPPVRPKFRNPANPSETWAGRGKQPRWLVSQLKAGKKIEDFLIGPKPASRAGKRA